MADIKSYVHLWFFFKNSFLSVLAHISIVCTVLGSEIPNFQDRGLKKPELARECKARGLGNSFLNPVRLMLTVMYEISYNTHTNILILCSKSASSSFAGNIGFFESL